MCIKVGHVARLGEMEIDGIVSKNCTNGSRGNVHVRHRVQSWPVAKNIEWGSDWYRAD